VPSEYLTLSDVSDNSDIFAESESKTKALPIYRHIAIGLYANMKMALLCHERKIGLSIASEDP
jgi:hypothetical protein